MLRKIFRIVVAAVLIFAIVVSCVRSVVNTSDEQKNNDTGSTEPTEPTTEISDQELWNLEEVYLENSTVNYLEVSDSYRKSHAKDAENVDYPWQVLNSTVETFEGGAKVNLAQENATVIGLYGILKFVSLPKNFKLDPNDPQSLGADTYRYLAENNTSVSDAEVFMNERIKVLLGLISEEAEKDIHDEEAIKKLRRVTFSLHPVFDWDDENYLQLKEDPIVCTVSSKNEEVLVVDIYFEAFAELEKEVVYRNTGTDENYSSYSPSTNTSTKKNNSTTTASNKQETSGTIIQGSNNTPNKQETFTVQEPVQPSMEPVAEQPSTGPVKEQEPVKEPTESVTPEKTLVSISATFVGGTRRITDKFYITDFAVTAHYSDGSSVLVSDATLNSISEAHPYPVADPRSLTTYGQAFISWNGLSTTCTFPCINSGSSGSSGGHSSSGSSSSNHDWSDTTIDGKIQDPSWPEEGIDDPTWPKDSEQPNWSGSDSDEPVWTDPDSNSMTEMSDTEKNNFFGTESSGNSDEPAWTDSSSSSMTQMTPEEKDDFLGTDTGSDSGAPSWIDQSSDTMTEMSDTEKNNFLGIESSGNTDTSSSSDSDSDEPSWTSTTSTTDETTLSTSTTGSTSTTDEPSWTVTTSSTSTTDEPSWASTTSSTSTEVTSTGANTSTTTNSSTSTNDTVSSANETSSTSSVESIGNDNVNDAPIWNAG